MRVWHAMAVCHELTDESLAQIEFERLRNVTMAEAPKLRLKVHM